jgi:hypothetical protein
LVKNPGEIMKDLVKKQAKFSQDMAKLIQYIDAQGDHCTLAEAYRTPEQAAINAHKGIGIANSLHCHRLAIDLCLFDKDWKYCTAAKLYKKYAEYWLTLDSDNRAGYFFPKVDANHFESCFDSSKIDRPTISKAP